MHLIVSKDKEEIRQTLSSLLQALTLPTIAFYPENFSVDAFVQEVETLPFLSPKKIVIIHELDQLPEEGREAILRYAEKPSHWIDLFLTALELPSQSKLSKLIEKQGKVLRFKEEKPWEKEKRLAEWVTEEAKKMHARLSPQAARALVQSVDHPSLKCELDKLICFAYGRPEITVEDISLICTPMHHETLWQLGDALFMLATTRALEIGRALLEEGMAIFPLLASLRSQFTTGMNILSAGSEAAKQFPYLKGNLLEKKLTLFKKYGKERLRRGILQIFETEVKAKNSSVDPPLLLEILIIKLTHDFIPTPQLARSGR